jgi:hypothetical protein
MPAPFGVGVNFAKRSRAGDSRCRRVCCLFVIVALADVVIGRVRHRFVRFDLLGLDRGRALFRTKFLFKCCDLQIVRRRAPGASRGAGANPVDFDLLHSFELSRALFECCDFGRVRRWETKEESFAKAFFATGAPIATVFAVLFHPPERVEVIRPL